MTDGIGSRRVLDRNELGLNEKPGLIVVDMMAGFTDPASPLGHSCEPTVQSVCVTIDAFRKHSLPVYFTVVIYRDAAEASVFRRKLPALNLLTPDSKWTSLDVRIVPKENETVIEKKWASAFHQTDLAALCRSQGLDSIVVVGLTTSGCVRATAVDAVQYNFATVVLEDAVSDRDVDCHRTNLYDLQAKYCDVWTTDRLISSLS